MENKVINRCPICGDKLVVTSLRCEECETEIKGRFNLSVFDYLSESQQKFVLIFLKNGGNIKLIEKELKIIMEREIKFMANYFIADMHFGHKNVLSFEDYI